MRSTRFAAPRVPRPVLSSALTVALCLAACVKTDTPPPAQPEAPPPAAPAESPLEAILSASNLPGTVDSPLEGDGMGVTVHRLSNGMTVYISTDRQKPRISAWVAVRTGSRNDPANSTGLAHYLEHMLFKGTDELGTLDHEKEAAHIDEIAKLYDELRAAEGEEARKAIFAKIDAATQASAEFAVPNELSRLYGAMGVEGLNAFTSFDQTVYVADIPANRFTAWAKVEAERFADPVFRLFYPELEAVYEEKNRSLDSPFRSVYEAMLGGLFPAHPYGTQTTIGEVEHLKVPAYGDMVAYFDRWYAPNNMAIVLAGDIDAETALPVLEASLGQLEAKALEAPAPGKFDKPEGRKEVVVTAEGEQSVYIAWPTVAASHKDAAALEVMDWLMDNASTGLLNTELELTQRVPDAGSSHNTLHEAGWFEMHATARDGQSLDEVERLLMGVLDELHSGAFEQSDVDAVVLQTLVREKQSLEFAQARVAKMQDAFINRMEWSEVLAHDKAVREVTREDVVEVAQKYLGNDRVVVLRKRGKPELPKIDKPVITPVDIDNTRRSPFADAVMQMPTEQLEPDWLVDGKHYVKDTLEAGDLITAKNEANDLFTVVYSYERGSRDAALLCTAFDLLDKSGAGELDAEAWQKKLFGLGSSISFGCGADESSITVTGIDEHMGETLRLMNEWFESPVLEQDQLDAMVDNMISERRDHFDDPRWLGFALREYAMYGKESELLAEPSNRALQGAKVSTLKKLVQGVPNYAHRTMYFGPRAHADVKDGLELGTKHKKVPEPRGQRYRKQRGTKIYFLGRDVAKSSVGIGIPLGARDDAERPHARLLAEYFGGGMASIIFQEIREARGLAYFARGWVGDGDYKGDDWAFAGSMDTQSDKTVEALKVFLELVVTKPLDAARVKEARESLEQEYRSSRVEPRFIVYWVSSWFDRGDAGDPRPALREAVTKVDDAALQGFADELDKAPVIISILGNEEKIDMKALGEVAKITKVDRDDLFSWGSFPKVRKAKKKTSKDEDHSLELSREKKG